jgi:hypothetical protein
VALLKCTELMNAKWQSPSLAKGNVCIMVLGNRISYSSAQTLRPGIWKTAPQANAKGAAPSALSRQNVTGEDREQYTLYRFAVPQMAFLQPNVFTQQDGGPSTLGPDSESVSE